MNVTLTPELESLVNEKVQSGLYPSAGEVVRDALRMLRDRNITPEQRLEELKREIAIGLDELKRGEGVYYDRDSLKAMFEEVKQEGRKRMPDRQKEATL